MKTSTAATTMFDDYQLFTKTTAVYPQVHTIPYLTLGLCDEAGELLEKVEWVGSSFTTKNCKDILAEAGDVMWYMARLTDEMGISLGSLPHVTYGGEAVLVAVAVEISIQLSKVAGRVKKRLRDGDDWDTAAHARFEHDVKDALSHAMGAMSTLCTTLNSSVMQVMAENVRKLTDRKARDAIKGDGDNR